MRTRSKIREFLLQWLKVDQVPDLAKDRAQFAEFDDHIASDLRASLELFLESVVWSESSDFRQFLLEDELYVNDRLARFYGAEGAEAELEPKGTFRPVSLKAGERAGVLTHPYLMASFAYTASSSPIHRGVFLARSILGRALRPPPEAFAPLPAELHPELTTRERVSLQTKSDACIKCHGMINPLGFTLENFDAVGRFRDQEKGRPIDSSGAYLALSGESVSFTGVRDLARFLAQSGETHAAFVEQLFHALIKQPIRAYGSHTAMDLQRYFVENDFSIRKMLVQIASTAADPTRQMGQDPKSPPAASAADGSAP
jgi:hypothetical protein